MSNSVLEVVRHHVTCVARSDLQGIMEDYTEGSVLFSPDGVLEGREAIRAFFSSLTTSLMPAGTSLHVVREDHRGDTVFLLWQAEAPTMRFHLGAETLTVRDGKIATHSFAAAIEQKR